MAGGNMAMVFIVLTGIWAGARAQSQCAEEIISMSPCLEYITGNSATPTPQCCKQLATVVHKAPKCLCEVVNGGAASLVSNINQTRALALPGECKVKTPPVSNCSATSPATSPPSAQSPASTPSGTGSNTENPAQPDKKSAGSSVQLSISFFLLLAAFIGSTFATY